MSYKMVSEKCGYSPKDIFFFGYGQGAMAAIAAVLGMSELGEFGGIVSIGGPVPVTSLDPITASETPICVLGGSSNTPVMKSALADVNRCFADVSYHRFERVGDGMPRSREEMYPVMRFWRGG